MILHAHEAITDAVSDLAALVAAPVEHSTAELLPELDRIAAGLHAASGVVAPDAVQQYMHFELHLNQPAPIDTPVQLALGDADCLGRPEVSFNGGLSWQSMPELVLPAGTTTARVRLALKPDLLLDAEASRSPTATPAPGTAANADVPAKADRTDAIGEQPMATPLYTGGELGIVGQLVRPAGDAGSAGFLRQEQVSGCYGRFSVDSDGVWSYRLDPAAPELRVLRPGQSLTECFDARSADGTSHDVLITIRGGDDALVIYGIEISLPVLSH